MIVLQKEHDQAWTMTSAHWDIVINIISNLVHNKSKTVKFKGKNLLKSNGDAKGLLLCKSVHYC